MPKILVADDNSNIQKMVGMALKDQGIDVVAVGNGEAAVRKISDVRPDLVLADVFMPVRNGYEVCKYVKEDSALSHIPVILLVGAFDPLDEQEAQRVGADGVLKKPFVPPDPLISMVKSALSRAGVSYSGAAPGREEGAQPLSVKNAVPPAPTPEFEEPEPFHEPVSKRPAPLTIDTESQPLAFGSLLDTREAQEADQEADFVTPSNANKVPERNWGVRQEEQEIAEEEKQEAPNNSWRRSDAEEFDEPTPAGQGDWRETPTEPTEHAHKSTERWAPNREKTDLAETPQEAPIVTGAPEVAAPTPLHAEDAWAPGLPTSEEEHQELRSEVEAKDHAAKSDVLATFTLPAGSEALTTEKHEAEAASEPPAVQSSGTAETKVGAVPESMPSPADGSTGWFSVSSSPWDTEAQKASQLAATWDTGIPRPASEVPEPIEAFLVPEEAVSSNVSQEELEHPAVEQPVSATEGTLPTITPETVRQEAAQVVEEVVQAAAPARPETPQASAKEPNLDEVVARVLSRMSPEVLQAVTREILKPVVEALVREEISKK